MSTMTRRSVILSGLALGTAAALAPAGRLAHSGRFGRGALFEWKKLRDGVMATGGMTSGGNVLIAKKGGGMLFVDSKFAGLARTLRGEGEEALGGKAAMLINTHHHGDHTSGNVAFDGLTHMAHANAKARIEGQHGAYKSHLAQGAQAVQRAGGDEQTQRRAEEWAETVGGKSVEAWMPSKVAEGALTAHELDGLQIAMHHVGPGHTDNDLIVQLTELNVIHAGDLLFHKTNPFIDSSAGATTLGWMDSCRHMIELCDAETVVVPGHGEITDRTGLERQIQYFEKAREAGEEGNRRGNIARGLRQRAIRVRGRIQLSAASDPIARHNLRRDQARQVERTAMKALAQNRLEIRSIAIPAREHAGSG